VHAVQRALGIRVERSEQRVEIFLGRAGDGDEFEIFAHRSIRREAGDQDLGDLAPRNDAVAEISGMAFGAPQQDKPVLVRTVIVEPAGPEDFVIKSE
jgi:hypothetical protein